MNEQIQQLIELIREEESVLEDFLDTLTRQKEYIVQNNVEAFDKTVQEEEDLINRIRRLEDGRVEVVKSIASITGSEDDGLTLTRLIEMNLGEVSVELKNLKRTLAVLVERIKRANRVNQYLIKRSLSFIQNNIGWFIDENNLNVIYSQNGEQRMGDVGNILVDKVF